MKSCHEIAFLVKVCGITNADDARLALEAGANAMGFNFYRKSPRYLTIQEASEMAADALPGNYLRVGVFVHPSLADIVEAARFVSLDVIQIHGNVPGNLTARPASVESHGSRARAGSQLIIASKLIY